MPFWSWSKTAAANASADSSVNWAEGQPPSSINDSARAMMARTAEYRDDIAGAIVTAGTSTAYTVFSNQVFDTLPHLDGRVIAFTPHATNGQTVTLSVDSLGPKPLRSAPNVELPAGTLVQGTPYTATYSNTDGVFYLQGFYGNPYSVPLGGMMPFMGSTPPNSSFVLPYGQAISRTAYATLFGLPGVGTGFGAGDGSTTFNIPDLRGKVPAGVDNMGGTSGGYWPGLNPGTVGGAITVTIGQGNLPNVTLGVSGTTGGYSPQVGAGGAVGVPGGTSPAATSTTGAGNYFPASSFAAISGFSSLGVTGATAALGSGVPLPNFQPTIGINYILRVI